MNIPAATFETHEFDAQILSNIVTNLQGIGYGEYNICKHLGIEDLTELKWQALPIYRMQKLQLLKPLDVAIDFFLFQGKISIENLYRLFDEVSLETLERSGLIHVDSEMCFARASLFPVGNNLIFSDHMWPKLPNPGLKIIPYDYVMYIGTDSRWLARTTIRRQNNLVLDLCTGSGIQALLAARHSKKVIAVDINQRAAKCTNFNAFLSGISNIEVRIGDLYTPVKGEKFELITANPPFVPSPVEHIGFRDGGYSGENILKRIVEGLPSHLAAGGIAQIVTDIGERTDGYPSDTFRLANGNVIFYWTR